MFCKSKYPIENLFRFLIILILNLCFNLLNENEFNSI
jgi:hypothetical protein